MSLVKQFFKNVFASYANMLSGIAIAFFFTPYLIDKIGKSQYGIWNLAFSFIFYMSIADLGIRQALVRFVSKHLAKEEFAKLNRIFSSAAAMYSAIFAFLVIVIAVLVFGFLGNFQIPPDLFSEARVVVLVLGLKAAIGFLLLPFTALGAFNRYDVSNYFNLAQLILRTLIFVIILESGYGIIEMAVITLVLFLLQSYGMSHYRARHFPQVRFSVSSIKRESLKELFSYSIYSFLIVISTLLIHYSDNIVIGAFVSMQAVAVYSIPLLFTTHIRNIFTVISVPLVPAISQIETEKDFARIARIHQRATRYLFFISFTIVIVAITYGQAFINLWLGPEFSESVEILYILAVPAAIFIPQTINSAILYGISKHKATFFIMASEGTVNLVLSLILVQSMGIVGVAYGTAIPQMIIYLVVFPLVLYRILGEKLSRFYKTALFSAMTASAVILPLSLILQKIEEPHEWITLIAEGLVIMTVAGLLFVFTILTPDNRDKLFEKLRLKKAV